MAGRPIPSDDEPVADVKPQTLDETTQAGADAEQDEADQDVPAGDTDEAGDEFTPEDIDAALNEHAGWVPEAKFKELYADHRSTREDLERYRQDMERIRAEAEELRKQTAKPAEPAKPERDYAKELKELATRYDTTQMTMDEYLEARDGIKDAQREEKLKSVADERLAKLEKEIATDRQSREQERIQALVNQQVAAALQKYPFLDQEGEDYNAEAMKAVVAERDDLIRSGVHPAKAIKLAVAAVAPEFGEAAQPDKTNVADRKITRAPGAVKTPPNIGRVGAGLKETGGTIVLGRSIADHEKFEKMTEDQRKLVKFTA